jgi:hypothetical protein
MLNGRDGKALGSDIWFSDFIGLARPETLRETLSLATAIAKIKID